MHIYDARNSLVQKTVTIQNKKIGRKQDIKTHNNFSVLNFHFKEKELLQFTTEWHNKDTIFLHVFVMQLPLPGLWKCWGERDMVGV